jgi:hypothetical protein
MRTPVCIFAALLWLCARAAVAQTCSDARYRWTVKAADSLASQIAVRTTIRSMLTTWTLPPFTGQAQFKCTARAGRELKVYSLLGWVRRVKTDETDGDWHVELTARSDGPIDSCIVAEIPPVDLGANFGQARLALQDLVNWDSQGDVDPPVQLRFIGAAFFDGEHRGGPTHRDRTDGAHARCNSSAHALWELHPVYWVRNP